MGTIVHTFDPAAVVYVITTPSDGCPMAVLEGTVVQVRANALITGTTIKYDIKLGTDSGTTEFVEANIFADIASAMLEYQTRLTA